MEVLAAALDHRHGVPAGFGHLASPVDHVEHLSRRVPDREGRDRSKGSRRSKGEGGSRVIADQTLDRLAPVDEAKSLGEREARQRDRRDGRVELCLAVLPGEPVKRADVAPPPEKAQAHVPPGRERPAEARARQKVIHGGFVLPRGKQRQAPDLPPPRR